jgi:large subunit ribosomal protein L21
LRRFFDACARNGVAACDRQSSPGGNMYAIVKSGNKQYRVEKGDRIAVEKLPNPIGDQVKLDVVFLGDGDNYKLGKDAAGASVVAQVVDERKGRKVISFDYRNKHRRRTTHGHRQIETHLEIKEIVI